MKSIPEFSFKAALLVAGLALAGLVVGVADTGAQVKKPLLEFAGKTTCGFCKYAHQALRELYPQRNGDFHYVSLVCDRSSSAYARARNDYNFYGYPSVFFDGGYRVSLGAGSSYSAKVTYDAYVNHCRARPVPQLDLYLDVEWTGRAKMDIIARVKNKGAAGYSGRVRVYITEIKSSLGWRDTGGFLYTYAFLDFAMNHPISLSGGKDQAWITSWNGSFRGYPNLSYDNIVVIAAVFNGYGVQGYAYPPNRNPFTAYYVDATARAQPKPLGSDTKFVSQYGGAVNFGLYAYPQNANRPYLLAGSFSGTTPGTLLPGGRATLPLNLDYFTYHVIYNVNSHMFTKFMGNLDSKGSAAATLNVPAIPGTVGVKLFFAYTLWDKFDFVSNPLMIEIR